jgi:hypothetical protein
VSIDISHPPPPRSCSLFKSYEKRSGVESNNAMNLPSGIESMQCVCRLLFLLVIDNRNRWWSVRGTCADARGRHDSPSMRAKKETSSPSRNSSTTISAPAIEIHSNIPFDPALSPLLTHEPYFNPDSDTLSCYRHQSTVESRQAGSS